MRTAILLSAALSVLVVAGCSVKPTASDRGYEGTWVRGNDRVRSVVSIVEEDGSYRFRWNKQTDDDRMRVECDWDGSCEELLEDRTIGTYRFRTWVDEESGHLMVECTGRIEEPEPRDVHYVDELVLSSDGLRLTAYSVRQKNIEFPRMKGPSRMFDKLSDAVADPPGREPGS